MIRHAPEANASGVFVLHPEDGVYVRRQNFAFQYSDGEHVESRIYDILRSARDLSSASPELQAAISDWPTEYHFTSKRQNLLRHLPFGPEHDVLEIGSGCGAITRCLGETGARVIGVEGSFARSRCARMRCRDLANVEIYCSNFQDFETTRRFDVVTLIGVLEYAPLYIAGPNPMLFCLERAAALLKPDGVLIVAIENQLGLKYFCGYPEDHLNIPYFGIQDQYNSATPRTVGRRELLKLLSAAGFEYAEVQYPFPDYKLPAFLFFDRAFETPGFRASEIIQQLPSRDYTGVNRDVLPEHLTWPVLARNGLVQDFANSFLAFGSRRRDHVLQVNSDLLAVGYTNDRAPEYNTIKTFRIDADDEIWITRHLAERPSDASALRHVAGPERYATGTHLGMEMLRCIETNNWPKFSEYFGEWTTFLATHSTQGDGVNALETELDGAYFDCVPSNLIRTATGLVYIDREWLLITPVCVGTVVLRYLIGLYNDARARRFLASALETADETRVLCVLLQRLALKITDKVVKNYVYTANVIQSLVYPNKPMIDDDSVRRLFTAQLPSHASTPKAGSIPATRKLKDAIRVRVTESARHIRSAIRVWLS